MRRVPAPAKRIAHFLLDPLLRARRNAKFSYEIARLREFNGGPPAEALATLMRLWGNTAFVASVDFLTEAAFVCNAARGAVLECGSGLSTLVCAASAVDGTEIWSLEHDGVWAQRTAEVAHRSKLRNVHVIHAPLRMFDDSYAWYDAPLDRMPRRFDAVICDGPPGSTLGGRYGLLPQCRSRLQPGCVILLDDAARESERTVLELWQKEADVDVAIRETVRPYARVTLR